MRLWFGRFDGWRVDEVPGWYLRWLAQQPWLDATLAHAVRVALEIDALEQRRDELLAEIEHLEGELAGGVPAGLAERWLRTMARHHHPDAGGTNEAMRIVNQGYELLSKLLADAPTSGATK